MKFVKSFSSLLFALVFLFVGMFSFNNPVAAQNRPPIPPTGCLPSIQARFRVSIDGVDQGLFQTGTFDVAHVTSMDFVVVTNMQTNPPAYYTGNVTLTLPNGVTTLYTGPASPRPVTPITAGNYTLHAKSTTGTNCATAVVTLAVVPPTCPPSVQARFRVSEDGIDKGLFQTGTFNSLHVTSMDYLAVTNMQTNPPQYFNGTMTITGPNGYSNTFTGVASSRPVTPIADGIYNLTASVSGHTCDSATINIKHLADSGINDGLFPGYENTTMDLIQGITTNGSGHPYSPDLKMEYILQLVVEKTDITGPVNFVNNANSRGMMPIIRLCFTNVCSFKSASDIYTYFEQISQQVGTNKFIAVLGPNEPGTGEMEGFDVAHGDYATLVNWANQSANYLQQYRVVNGGNMYLAPAIFNGTNSQYQSDDVIGYLYSSPTIEAIKFDYILDNLYNAGGGLAEYFYNQNGRSVKQYVTNHPNLKTIVTEMGYFTGSLTDFTNSYVNLCHDTTVNGLLFFRPIPAQHLPYGYPAWTPRQDPGISPLMLQSIINACN